MKHLLGTLSPAQVAAVQVLLKQEQIQRQRLEAALQAMQAARLSATEQDEADRDALERERQAFVANRERSDRQRALESEPPPRMPEVPRALDPTLAVLQQLAGRLDAIEVALSQNRGHMPPGVTVQQQPPSFAAAPGFATPGAAPLFYNPGAAVNGQQPWPWRR